MKSNFRSSKNICIICQSLANGGLERSTAFLTKILSSKGYRVFTAVLNNKISYEYSGEIFNLGKHKDGNSNFIKKIQNFRRFKCFLKEKEIGLIIDTRVKKNSIIELFYHKYLYRNLIQVMMVHSYKIDNYFASNDLIAKYILSDIHNIICVSNEIRDLVNTKFKTKKASTIYNSADYIVQPKSPLAKPYIIALGRIDDSVKNFSLLLHAYNQSNLQDKLRLKIIGDGPDTLMLKHKARYLGISNYIDFIEFTPNVEQYIAEAKFLMLTSRYEGFPMVIIEALSLNTPVISVDCSSGPKELIKNHHNGILVDNYNVIALADAMVNLYENSALYEHCKSNAKSSINHLSLDKISRQWDNLISKIL